VSAGAKAPGASTTQPPAGVPRATTSTTRGPTGAPATTSGADPTTTTLTPLARARIEPPPYPVVQVTVPLVDTTRPTVSHGRTISASRALTTLVWVPEEPGRWPLVVFSHGFDVGPLTYEALLRAWAAHGYVVAAPEFPLTDPALAGANLDENDIDNQPADVRFVTDTLVSPGQPLAAKIDASRVAVAGHSDGAEAALAASVDPTPAGAPAYRAVIAMSVSPLAGTAPTANPPLLVTQGDVDTINPPALGYQTWNQAASPKYLDVLHGGGHLPPLEAGSGWLPGVEALSEAFLDYYVAGDGTEKAIIGAGVSPLATLQAG
jgi:acetyl esterase/lipase